MRARDRLGRVLEIGDRVKVRTGGDASTGRVETFHPDARGPLAGLPLVRWPSGASHYMTPEHLELVDEEEGDQ